MNTALQQILTGASHEDSRRDPNKHCLKGVWSAHDIHRKDFGLQVQNSAEKPLFLVPNTYLKKPTFWIRPTPTQ